MLFDFYRLLHPKRWDGADKNLYANLKELLGFAPHTPEYYLTAFAHRSSDVKSKNGRPLNNERLEYLGDAVLETVVSDILFHHFPRRREGFLTSTRSKIVQRSTLNQLADQMGLLRFVKVSMRPSSHCNIGGNAFEALMGAIYLDRGYKHCQTFIERQVLGKYLDLDKLARKEENFKSKLLEWAQKNKLKMEFAHVSTEPQNGGALNNFVYEVVVEGVKCGTGKGLSKKESHQQAARITLQKLKRDQQLVDRIFTAKEQRTQMEAEMYAAVPS